MHSLVKGSLMVISKTLDFSNDYRTFHPKPFCVKYFSLIILVNNVGDCSCSDYKSSSGYGRCEKVHSFYSYKGTFCYVNLPSTCSDARDSATEQGKKLAWEPCNGKIQFLYMNLQILLSKKFFAFVYFINFIIFIIIATSRKKRSLGTIKMDTNVENGAIGNNYYGFMLSL